MSPALAFLTAAAAFAGLATTFEEPSLRWLSVFTAVLFFGTFLHLDRRED